MYGATCGCGSSPATPGGARGSWRQRCRWGDGTSSMRTAPTCSPARRRSCGATCCAGRAAGWPWCQRFRWTRGSTEAAAALVSARVQGVPDPYRPGLVHGRADRQAAVAPAVDPAEHVEIAVDAAGLRAGHHHAAGDVHTHVETGAADLHPRPHQCVLGAALEEHVGPESSAGPTLEGGPGEQRYAGPRGVVEGPGGAVEGLPATRWFVFEVRDVLIAAWGRAAVRGSQRDLTPQPRGERVVVDGDGAVRQGDLHAVVGADPGRGEEQLRHSAGGEAEPGRHVQQGVLAVAGEAQAGHLRRPDRLPLQ